MNTFETLPQFKRDFLAVACGVLFGLLFCFLHPNPKPALIPHATNIVQSAYGKWKVNDFLTDDAWAKSNAVRFQAPPDGWDIVCDDYGHFAPREGGQVRDFTNFGSIGLQYVRTSRIDAITVAWRLKGIYEAAEATTPKQSLVSRSTNLWKECPQ